MPNNNIYSKSIMYRMRQFLNLEENDESKDLEIMAMPYEDVLNNLLLWEGIIGYTELILSWIRELRTNGWIIQ